MSTLSPSNWKRKLLALLKIWKKKWKEIFVLVLQPGWALIPFLLFFMNRKNSKTHSVPPLVSLVFPAKLPGMLKSFRVKSSSAESTKRNPIKIVKLCQRTKMGSLDFYWIEGSLSSLRCRSVPKRKKLKGTWGIGRRKPAPCTPKCCCLVLAV